MKCHEIDTLLLFMYFSFLLSFCNNWIFYWKTSDHRAAVHLNTLSTFLWIPLRTYWICYFTYLYLSFHFDGLSKAGHTCSTNGNEFSSFLVPNRIECLTCCLPHLGSFVFTKPICWCNYQKFFYFIFYNEESTWTLQ